MNAQRKPLPLDEPAVHPQAAPAIPPAGTVAPLSEPLTDAQIADLNERIIAALCSCFDPEIPVNIYELGLIYDIVIARTGELVIRMTLTSPACPVAGTLPGDVQRKLQPLPNVVSVKVETVWEPPWTPDRMSEAAKLELGMD